MELHDDQLDLVCDIQHRIKNKMMEIETSDALSEENVKVWLEDIKKEISDVHESSSFELNVAKDPVLMKEASDMIVKIMSPDRLEVKAEDTSLLAEISKGLDVHYDRQES